MGLTDAEKNDLVAILEKNRKIEQVILFGSRVKGNYKAGSDIDLSLIGKDLKLDDIVNAMIEIDKLFLPYKIDIIIYDRIEEKALKEHIDRVGITIFDRQSLATI